MKKKLQEKIYKKVGPSVQALKMKACQSFFLLLLSLASSGTSNQKKFFCVSSSCPEDTA